MTDSSKRAMPATYLKAIPVGEDGKHQMLIDVREIDSLQYDDKEGLRRTWIHTRTGQDIEVKLTAYDAILVLYGLSHEESSERFPDLAPLETDEEFMKMRTTDGGILQKQEDADDE